MDTITIPRTDYVQRHDDEGRDFYAGRTVGVAADLWIAQDPTKRAWDLFGEVFSFVVVDEAGITISAAGPDEDMEDLYPAGDLPFAIAASPFAPGDVVTWSSEPLLHTVTNINADSTVDLANGATVFASQLVLAAAPTGTPAAEPVVFVVTLPAGLSAEDADLIRTWLKELQSTGAKRRGVTVREAR